MFSEYASKFLAQSQSRLSAFGQPAGDDNGSTAGGDAASRRAAADWPSSSRAAGSGRPYGRSFLGRGFGGAPLAGPYQAATSGSRFGQLNFASRYVAAPDAPLFHEVEEEDEAGGLVDDDRGGGDDDELERDREAADLYALQRSRRVFAASRLEESSGTENERSRASMGESREDESDGGGRGGRSLYRSRHGSSEDGRGGRGRGEDRMEDVGLESTVADDSEPPPDLTVEAGPPDTDDDDNDDGRQRRPPAFQRFAAGKDPRRFTFRRDSYGNDSELGLLHKGPGAGAGAGGARGRGMAGGLGADSEASFAPDTDAAAAAAAAAGGGVPASDVELFRHDPFFAWIYLIALASLFATFVLVYLHTSVPGGGGGGGKNGGWGDTIYTTLLSSLHLLAVDTLVAVIVSMVWLAALRSFSRHLVATILVAVPVILVSFTIYPLVASFQGGGSGSGSTRLQDTVMRWAALVPGVSAAVWVYLVWKGRYALRSAVDILEFASRILAANSALVLVGLGCLVLVVVWTWAWLAMFTRVFLGGTFSSRLSRFIISTSSWWLGAYFVLMYLWTLSVLAGAQRAATGATVSQWYFHRNVQPAPSSNEVVSAALHHALTTIFGSICQSTLLALAVRLPLLVLPRRLAQGLGLVCYSFVPAPIAALTNPLTLTYAAIHSQSLAASAQGLSQLDFLAPEGPTTTLTPRAFARRRGGLGGRRRRGGSSESASAAASSPLLPYRLAKLLLHATRFIMATALGFAGWVMTARQLRIAVPDGPGSGGGGGGGSLRGSAYAYVVGLVASFIGWGVLGAMEGILSGIVDAVVICYGSETRMAGHTGGGGGGGGGGGYCMEAAYLFGGRGSDTGDDDDGFRRTNREVY